MAVPCARLRYERWRDTRLIKTQLELFTLRWWGINEFELAHKVAGFGDIIISIISGSHEHGRAPMREDWMITFEAQRN
jgi:hypothetical protein